MCVSIDACVLVSKIELLSKFDQCSVICEFGLYSSI